MAGVDLLRSNAGPKVLEINSSPGLQEIERASGKDVANLMVEFIEKNVKSNVRNKRGGRPSRQMVKDAFEFPHADR